MDELEAVGNPELRETLLWVRGQERPVTADELAEAHGVHRNVARSRLGRLVQAGLLAASYERRTGRTGPGAGRPAKVYAVTPELAAIEFPERHLESLVGLLAGDVPPGRLREIGVEFGRELARSASLRPLESRESGFTRMCEGLRGLGFQASVDSVTPDGAVIATPTCPLRPLVRAYPETAEIDRGMWVGLAESAIAGVEAGAVTCETRDCTDDHASCHVVFRF